MAIRFVIQTISTFCCFWITAGLSTSNCTVYDFDGKNRSNVFECESPGIISCKVTPNSGFIQWFIADPIEPSTSVAGQCLGSSCTPFNDFSGRYAYTYNQGDGIANITIRNISSADRGLKYKINDGTLQQIFEPITKVFPDKITASINFTDDKGTQDVTVSTDCTLLSENITFVWQKTKNSSGAELEPWAQDDVKHTVIKNLDDTLCPSTHTCGNTIFSSTLMFKPGNSGDAYYLHCTVVVNDENGPPNKIWISSNSYQLKAINNSTVTSTTAKPAATTTTYRTPTDSKITTVKTDTSATEVDAQDGLPIGAIVGIVIASIVTVVITVVVVTIRFTNMGKKCVDRCKDPKK